MSLDRIVAGISVGDQSALEARSKDIESYLAGTGTVDIKEGEIGISRIPEKSAFAIDAPMGFIAVDNVRAANLVAQMFMKRFGSMSGAPAEGERAGCNKTQTK